MAPHEESFRLALDAGVQVAMGTDAPVMAHGRNLEEISMMVQYGMSPARAWAAATRSAAHLMRLDDELGTLEPGTRLASRVRQVWQGGVRVPA